MTIAPTREEWLERRDILHGTHPCSPTEAGKIMWAVLGPCPPEPPPKSFCVDSHYLVAASRHGMVIIPGKAITANEAEAMAASLIEHARYAREQGGDDG